MKKKLFWITGIIVITLIGVAVIGLNYTGSNTSQFTGPGSTDEPFQGGYLNDELGDVKLVLHEDKTLWDDFGEYESLIRPLITEENQFIFFESAFIGKTLQLKIATDGSSSMRWSGNEGTYDFVATSIQEQTK